MESTKETKIFEMSGNGMSGNGISGNGFEILSNEDLIELINEAI